MSDIMYQLYCWKNKRKWKQADKEAIPKLGYGDVRRYVRLRDLGVPPKLAFKHCRLKESTIMMISIWDVSDRKVRKKCEQIDSLRHIIANWVASDNTKMEVIDKKCAFPFLKGLTEPVSKIELAVYLFKQGVSADAINAMLEEIYPFRAASVLGLMRQYDKVLDNLFINSFCIDEEDEEEMGENFDA